MLFIGPEAERKFGRRHFMGLMVVFAAPPEFTMLHGREEIGRTAPVLLVDRMDGPRLLLLAGRSWRVAWTELTGLKFSEALPKHLAALPWPPGLPIWITPPACLPSLCASNAEKPKTS
jgi:hypothetical protein